MIRGIQHFSTELKTKIDVIPRGCFNVSVWKNNPISIYRDLYIWKIPFDQCLTARTVLPQSTHYLRQLFMARTWLEYGLRLHPPSLPHKKTFAGPTTKCQCTFPLLTVPRSRQNKMLCFPDQRWLTAGAASPTLAQRWANAYLEWHVNWKCHCPLGLMDKTGDLSCPDI